MKHIVYIGQDDETCRYLGRRIKAMETRQVHNLDEFTANVEHIALVVLELDGDFAPPFLRVVGDLKDKGIPFIVK